MPDEEILLEPKPKKHGFKTSLYLSSEEAQMLTELKIWHRRHASSLIRILIMDAYKRMKLEREETGYDD